MKALVVVCLLGVGLIANSQSTQTGPATATGECAVSHSGNYDRITIQNCGIGKEQGEKIIQLLQALAANKDRDDQNAKLDELLEITKRIANPYGSVTTYQPEGTRRTVTQSSGMTNVDSAALPDFQLLSGKEKSGDWQGLLDLAQKSIEQYPGWFTPMAFVGEAQMRLCHPNEAKEAFTEFLTDSEGADAFAPMRTSVQNSLANLQSDKYKAYCANKKP